jgi:hypothetical protein
MKNHSFLRAAAVLAALAALSVGCQKQPPAKVTSHPDRTFKISVGSGGGFTGAYEGCTLSSDGVVRLWSRRGAAAADTTLGLAQGSVEKALGFESRLRASGALEASHAETGNMTASVRYEIPESTYAWTWSGSGENEKTPLPFRAWYTEVQTYCREFSGTAPAK